MEKQFDDIIRKSCCMILERFQKHAADYGFIDTKFNIVTGKEFDGSSAVYDRNMIFGWIQGRALESLAKHYDYFLQRNELELCSRIKTVLSALTEKLQNCCAANGGHLYFAMTPSGAPVGEVHPDHSSFADLFYAKGLFCAAHVLKDPRMALDAEQRLDVIFSDMEQERFISGQQCFDPKNPAAKVSADQVPEGPRMISLGAFSDLIRLSEKCEKTVIRAEQFIRFIIENHSFVHDSKRRFFENINRVERTPVKENGIILCDPGHGIEFTGLAGRTLRMMQKRGCGKTLIGDCRAVLPELFCNLFDSGFRKAGGIVKAVDALSGKILNSDMPWWSLPESIRAAEELKNLYPEYTEQLSIRQEKAGKALLSGYIQSNGFCCQTRNEQGEIVQVIPAVPDADPGYHTNLSLMPL